MYEEEKYVREVFTGVLKRYMSRDQTGLRLKGNSRIRPYVSSFFVLSEWRRLTRVN